MPLSRDDFTIALLLVVSIFLPPLAVLCVNGCDSHFFLNVLLCLLAWFGAVIHAIWVVLYYGHGGRLSWGERRRLARRGGALTYAGPARPAHVEGGYRDRGPSVVEAVGLDDHAAGQRYA